VDAKKLLISAAIVGFSIGLNACEEHSAKTVASNDEVGTCLGVNSCKGQSSCHTEKSSCAGTNSCKGQGQLKKTAAECKKLKGKFKA